MIIQCWSIGAVGLSNGGNWETGKICIQARELLNRSRELNPDKLYNFACLEALEGNLEECRKHLEHCLVAGTLPIKNIIMEDRDLEAVRDKDWFKALVEKAPE